MNLNRTKSYDYQMLLRSWAILRTGVMMLVLLALLTVLLMLASCRTPERTLSITSWGPGQTTHTQVLAHEVGVQLLLSDRHDALAAGGAMVTSDISGAGRNAVETTAIGALLGAYLGGLPGAAVGGAGGAAAGMLGSDKPTTATAVSLAPMLTKTIR